MENVQQDASRRAALRTAMVGITHCGLVRHGNEDAFVLAAPPAGENALAVVADGIGGHYLGDIASECTCRELLRDWLGGIRRITDPEAMREALNRAICEINLRLYKRNSIENKPLPMGTTVVAAALMPEHVVVLHAGDSRMYEFTAADELLRLTSDHTLWARLAAEKHLSPDEEAPSSIANVIMNAVGPYPTLKLTGQILPRHPGSRYMLCSDGLTHCVKDAAVAEIFRRRESGEKTLNNLLRAALFAGGSDNITIICCDPVS